jgi:hypothetical protein
VRDDEIKEERKMKMADEAETKVTEDCQMQRDKYKKKDKVIITGFADSWKKAPFNDESFEVWGMNSLFELIPRWDLWFEIHDVNLFELRTNKEIGYGLTRTGQPYLEALAQLKCKDGTPCPVMMVETYPDIPNGVRYPFEFARDKLGNYFTNSVSYMIALAILWGYKEIHIFGVDMATNCVAPETRILTSDLRWIPASEVKDGDELIAFDEYSKDGDGHSRRWRKTKVKSATKIQGPSWETCFEDGTKMITSSLHGWLTHGENENRWKTTEDLMTRHHRSDRPTRALKLLPTWETDNSREAGYLAAAFDGEGHLVQGETRNCGTHTLRIGFSQHENAMSQMVEDYLGKYKLEYSVNRNNGTRKYQINGGRPELLRFLGQIRPVRLLSKFSPEILGQLTSRENVAVTESRFIGDHSLIAIQTDTKTFIAEGFANHNTEYGTQRPSCEYYVGIAVGMGIKVYIPPEADLLKAEFMYGFEGEKKLSFISKMESLITSMDQRRAIAMQNQAMSQRSLDQLIGRMEQMKLQKEWPELASDGGKKKLDEEIAKYNIEWSNHLQALDLARKQADQYVGAVEGLREAIKIRLLFK